MEFWETWNPKEDVSTVIEDPSLLLCELTGSIKRELDTEGPKQRTVAKKVKQVEREPAECKSASGTGLAFHFPDWEVKMAVSTVAAIPDIDFLKDLDELEGQEDWQDDEASSSSFAAPVKVLDRPADPDDAHVPQASPGMPAEVQDGCSLLDIPTDVFVRVAKDLPLRALISLGSSCRRLHALTLLDSLWEPHTAPPAVTAAADTTGSSGNPVKLELVDHLRWLSGFDKNGAVIVRSNRPAVRAEQQRVLRCKFLQVAEKAVTTGGCLGPDAQGQLGLQQHLARHLASADCVDGKLLSLWRSHGSLRLALCELWLTREISDPTWLRCIILQLTRFSWSLTYEALCGAFVQVSDAIALEVRTRLAADDLQGLLQPRQRTELWTHLLEAWHTYNQWLSRVVSLCTRLSECVSAEQAAEMMARGRFDTPSIYDAGKAAFRSQVVLRYGLRARLQADLLDATLLYKAGRGSKILRPVRKFLDEVDVQDDGTAAPELLTRDKLRHVFGLEPSAGQLQIRGPLRVPQP